MADDTNTKYQYAALLTIEPPEEDAHKYSPSKIKESIISLLWGKPNRERICTSHVERQNLNIRTAVRRFTRLSIGFSKMWENLKAALALLRLLQLLPGSLNHPLHSRDGSRTYESIWSSAGSAMR